MLASAANRRWAGCGGAATSCTGLDNSRSPQVDAVLIANLGSVQPRTIRVLAVPGGVTPCHHLEHRSDL